MEQIYVRANPMKYFAGNGLLGLSTFVFILMFAAGMAGPVVPLYASSRGASWSEIGLLGASWATSFMLLAILTGRISDRLGRKPLLIASGALSASAALLYLASREVGQLILVRIIEGAAWAMFWPPIEALATEIVEPAKTGRAIGVVTASYGIAFSSGALAGGTIVGSLGYAWMFLSYLAISLISVMAAILLVAEPRRLQVRRIPEEGKVTPSQRILLSRTLFLAYFWGAAYTSGLGIILTLLSVFAKGLDVSVFWIGALFGIFWLGRIFGSFAGGRLSDRYGRKPVAISSMIAGATGFSLIAASTGIEGLFVGILAVGLSIGAAFPTGVALVSDNITQSARGYAMGIFETSCAAGFMVASTFGGFLADFYSPRAPYVLGTFAFLFAATILKLKLPRK